MKEMDKNELLEINGGGWIGNVLRWFKRQIIGLSEFLELF